MTLWHLGSAIANPFGGPCSLKDRQIQGADQEKDRRRAYVGPSRTFMHGAANG